MTNLEVEFAEVLDSEVVDQHVWDSVNRIGFPWGDNETPTPVIPGGDEWNYYYYADPALDRVVIVDPITMTLVGWIPSTEGGHPGSVDRAGHTVRMYVRTGGTKEVPFHTFDVIDAQTRQKIGKIHLPDPDNPTDESSGLSPRGCGTYNKFKNLQVISHKHEPLATVIDVNTDRPAYRAVGQKVSGEHIVANYDTNATGHSTWLDANHFALLDRFRNNVDIYKITENPEDMGKFLIVRTHSEVLPVSAHVIDTDIHNQDLTKTVFWALIEGSLERNIAPHIIELVYQPDSGVFQRGATGVLPGVGASDQAHHYGYWEKFKELWVPTWLAQKTFVFDVTNQGNLSLKNDTGYDTGLGGSHVNFSDTLDLAIITNHFDRMVHIIERDGDVTPVLVTQNSDTTVPEIGYWRQSHINHVTPDGLFFHLFSIQDGIFVEVNLTTKTVSRVLYTGGNPEQSSS